MIKDLATLDPEALIKLCDRANYIKKILDLELTLINNSLPLAAYLDPLLVRRITTGYICVLYRSLFQAAYWSSSSRREGLDPKALLGPMFQGWKPTHEEIIHFTDKVAAHQDVTTDKRGLHAQSRNSSGGEAYLVWELSPNHLSNGLADALKEIKKNIKYAYLGMTGKPLKVL